MKQLISCVVLGCTLLLPGVAASNRHGKSKQRVNVAQAEYDTSEQEMAAMEPIEEYSEDVVAPAAPMPTTATQPTCCQLKKRPWTKWTQILAADKTQCDEYIFVQKQNFTADELCASLGLTVPSGCGLPEKAQCCAQKCGYKNSGKTHSPCRKCYSDSSEDERDNSSSDEKPEKQEPETWKYGCKHVTVCAQPTCQSCQAPQLLTFEDGTDQTCDFFVFDPKGTGACTRYRGFKIENGGVFDAWANRCECTNMSTLLSVISQQKVLTNSKASEPMEFSRDQPFTLISMFVGFSSPKDTYGTVKISVYKGGKYTNPEVLKLSAGVPKLYKPSTPICDIEKIRFQFVPSANPKFVNIDNMLLCM